MKIQPIFFVWNQRCVFWGKRLGYVMVVGASVFFWWLSKIVGHPKIERNDRLNPQVEGNTVQCSFNILLFGTTFIHVDEVQIIHPPHNSRKGIPLHSSYLFRVTSYK